MPELPDVEIYCEALNRYYAGGLIDRIDVRSPFLVRSFEPELTEAAGRRIAQFRRLGKRIVWKLDGDLHFVLHLMIAGRLHRKRPGAKPKGKIDLAAFHLRDAHGAPDTLMLTEASPRKRASLHVVQGADGLDDHDPGGLELLDCTLAQFQETLLSENHTLKRSLTDPRLFSGIGNAFSDEILHAAGFSPVQWTSRLDEEQIERLYETIRSTLRQWTDRLREQLGDGFPEKVTAFRPEMAVHGKYGQPCPKCETLVQRIRYANNETNYCPRCQTGGKLLADRSLSRLLKEDWPRTIEELES